MTYHRPKSHRTRWWRRRYFALYRYVARHRKAPQVIVTPVEPQHPLGTQPVPVDSRIADWMRFERAQWFEWEPYDAKGHERWQAAYK